MTRTDTPVPPERRDRASRGMFMILALVVVVLVVGALVFLFTGNAEESAQPAAEDPQTALADAITAEVTGSTVEFTDGMVSVEFLVRQGASPSAMILSAQHDTIGVLRAVKASDWEETVEITARTASIESVGDQDAPDEQEMLRVVYLPETVEQIDPDAVAREDVWEMADERFVGLALTG
ncbi:hypothetical protein G6027_17925 [Dietzia sp. SLG310A2-38A2]|uniref:hypothetical protein n=1 Tax=Dietzia sp. SLG310A2-38A2 TaxID=1630643 RepID=UPI0015F79C49|nr:hypothetical protein [Dietzia sp. SLG310A2-38A2]MBB1032706.1 hypothetical protein [Dietzia sp. SLG310A2-38A2]